MAVDFEFLPNVGDPIELTDYTRLRDNDRALAGALGGVVLWTGGNIDFMVDDTSAVALPGSQGGAGFEIDGTYLTYTEVRLEATARRAQDSGPGNVSFDLYNVTDGAPVAGSFFSLALSSLNATHGKSFAFALANGMKRYQVRLYVSDVNVPVGAMARVVARGA